MAKKTNYLTELIERHERWKAEGGERLEEEEQTVAQDLYVAVRCQTRPRPHLARFVQARQRRPRRFVGLWDRPTRWANNRSCQQLDQSLGTAFDVGDERFWTRRYLLLLHLDQAHLELVHQGRPSTTPVITQVCTRSERVRASDRQTYVARRSGVC